MDKVLHVVPMAAKAWIYGLFVPLAILSFGAPCCEPFMSRLSYVLPTLVLISCIALVTARRDREALRPIHIVLGSAILPLIVCALWLISNPDSYLDPDICWLFFVTPAAGVVGMIRGVRGRSTPEPLSSLFWCAVLIASCCISAWGLSRPPLNRVFFPRTGGLTIPYTPPQLDTKEPTSANRSHTPKPTH